MMTYDHFMIYYSKYITDLSFNIVYCGKMQSVSKCLWLYSHKKSHDTLSVFCLRPGPYHLALTSRNGSLHQQLSAPFSLSPCPLKAALTGSLSSLLCPVPFSSVHNFFFAYMSYYYTVGFFFSFLILSYSLLPEQEESHLSRGAIIGTTSIKARLTTKI